eukprot:scaffold24.g2960.t1
MSLPNGGSFRRSSSGRHEREKTTRRKGLVGASGLGLDHAEIPMIEKQVYAVLEPLVQRLDEPIPLSQFSQSACDALLPVLPKRRPLTDHEFKSQWGRLNEFVAPKLAAMKGWGDSGYSREEKTVRLAIAVPSGAGVALATPATAAPAPAASTARQKGGAGGPGGPAEGAGTGAGAAAAPVAAAGSAEGTAGLGAAGPGGGEAAPQAPRAPGGPCPVALGAARSSDFHLLLQSIYQASVGQSLVARVAAVLERLRPQQRAD